MNPEINEAIDVLNRMLNDVNVSIDSSRKQAKFVRDKEARENENTVQVDLPDLYPNTYAKLNKKAPLFAQKPYVKTAFTKNKPMFFGMIKRRTHDKELEFIRIQYLAWIMRNYQSEADRISQDLSKMYAREAEIKKVLAALNRLNRHDKPINEQLIARIKKLAGSSYNHYAEGDGIEFTENWVEFGELVTELFITYEALTVTDALAEVVEQVYDDNAQYVVEVNEQGDWIQHSENAPSESFQPSFDNIKTDDSLGYFS